MINTQFGRVITAMITPFTDNDEVSFDEAVRLANYLINSGSDTILLTGTTGESPTLTHEEEYQLYKTIRANIPKKAKIMAGTGSNCTRTAILATQQAEKLGADASLQVVPYYNKPSQEGMYQHFKAIAESTDLPIVLYNIPGRTAKNMEPETIARLAQIKNIIGIKEAAGSIEQVQKIRQLTPPEFVIYSGDDCLTLDFMEEGAYGIISVASHIAGQQIKAMIEKFVHNKKIEARQIETILKPLFEVLFITANPVPVKAALRMNGFKVGKPRLPLVDVTPEEANQIKAVLEQLQLI